MREIKISMTPITEETFKRQGWQKYHDNEDLFNDDDEKRETDEEAPYFFVYPIPKERKDPHTPMFVSNINNEYGALKDLGLKPGQYFVEIMDMDGLGLCCSEEELEILYKALTGDSIEE